MQFKKWLENYQGNSNPMGISYVNTWHAAQNKALSGDVNQSVILMKKAADEAMKESPGEAKYYLATIAWLQGNDELVRRYAQDQDVIHTGNHIVLKRLLNGKYRNYSKVY